MVYNMKQNWFFQPILDLYVELCYLRMQYRKLRREKRKLFLIKLLGKTVKNDS